MKLPPFNRLDRLLLALGVVGLVLYLAIIPRHHPDAAATYGVGAEEATQQAAAFVEGAGYSLEGLTPLARLARAPELIDSLQARLGRRGAINVLTTGGRDRLPAYYWHIQWREAEDNDPAAGSAVRARVLPNGDVWSMVARSDYRPARLLDTEALRSAFDPALQVPAGVRLEALLSFDVAEAVDLDAADDSVPTASDFEAGTPLALGPNSAAALARAHLDRTAQGALPLAAQRVEPHPAHARIAARVVFDSEEPVLGQVVRTTVDVSATGSLLAIETVFNGTPEQLVPPGSLMAGAGASSLRNVLKYGGYALLIVFLLVVTLRRLSARALDARAALKDAIVVGLAAGASILLSAPMFVQEFGTGGMSFILLMTVIVLSNAFILAAVTFITSAGGDALARTHDDRPIRTLGLARQGSWINVPVGRSLLRGVALGMALVGLGSLLLLVFSDATLPSSLQHRYFESQSAYRVVLSAFMNNFWYAAILTGAAFVSLGSLIARWRPALMVPGLALALAALGVEVIKLPGDSLLFWFGTLLVGAFLADMYRRTDALTIFVALVAAGTIWWTREPLLVPGSNTLLDVAIGLLLVGGVAALGVYGLASGVSSDTLPVYEPEFVVEQRERARLQREFEIARHVQASFLPRSVPQVPGLELAARCVPAEEVGGDYYDLIPLARGRLAIVIGDVSGKGIQAAFFMTLVKGYLTPLAHDVDDPAEVLARLNAHFRASAPRGTFVSMIFGVIDMNDCTITFARAGHTPLLIKRASGAVEALRPPGMAIGMSVDAMFRESLDPQTIELCPEDLLVLYTDGVSEAMNRQRDLFSDERVVATVGTGPGRAGALLQSVMDDVREHVGIAAAHDDLTMVVVRVAAAAAAAPPATTAFDNAHA